MSALHDRIRSIRQEKGIPVSDMLSLLDIGRRNYQRYENGDVDIPSSKLLTIADKLGVSTDYLLGRSDKP